MNKIHHTHTNDKFKNQWGFIIACIGSSVGMANIWLFPYRIGEFGGSAFLIPYIIFVVLIGFTGVIGEMAFGRAMQTGPLGAFTKAFEQRGHKKLGELIGLIPVIGSLWNCDRIQRCSRLDHPLLLHFHYRQSDHNTRFGRRLRRTGTEFR